MPLVPLGRTNEDYMKVFLINVFLILVYKTDLKLGTYL